MPTNLAIDDPLLTEAQRVGGHRTKKATVTEALEEYIQRRKQRKIGSNTDFLICAVAARHGFPIYTTDDDFRHFAKVLPIALHEPNR